MSYTRPQIFVPGTFLRSCDQCGIRFRANELVRGPDGHFRCIRWCAEQTQLERDRISADSSKRREAPPPPFGTPYSFKDSHAEEAIIFNFLCNMRVTDSGWPGGVRYGAAPAFLFRGFYQFAQGSYSASAAGETMRYLYGLIVENKKPTAWITRAKTKLAELADWVYSLQIGFGTSSASTKSNDANYGAVNFTANQVVTLSQAQLGYGMLRAYQVLGTSRYLDSARGFADCLSTAQRDDLRTTGYTATSDNGTSRITYGAWGNQFNTTALPSVSYVYLASGLAPLEFLFALLGVAGDEVHGADTTLAGFMIQAPARLLSLSIAACRAFWSVGAVGAGAFSTPTTLITGFSATTPYECFRPFTNGVGGTSGSWGPSSGSTGDALILPTDWAIGLRSLYSFEGFSSQVSSVWNWLMSFPSNPSFEPTTSSLGQDAPTVQGTAGTYNPKIALVAAILHTLTKTTSSSTYLLYTAGYMAPIQAAQDSGSFELAKDFIVAGQNDYPDEYILGRPNRTPDSRMLLGQCGLSGAAATISASGFALNWRADFAPIIGQMFRYNASNTFQI